MAFLRLLFISLLSTLALAAPSPQGAPTLDRKGARTAYKQALGAEQKQDLASALACLRQAVDLDPGNAQYLTELAHLRQQVINQFLDNGNQALNRGNSAEALAQFNAALNLDPTNAFAQQRLRDAQSALPHPEDPLRIIKESGVVTLAPSAPAASLRFTGDSQAFLSQVAAAFGLRATFDDNFPTRIVSLDLDHAGLAQALAVSTNLARAMWVPISPTEVFFAANTPEKHREFDRMVLRTFYLRDFTTAQELNDISSVLRAMFDIRYVVVDVDQSLITLKAPQPVVEAATVFLENLSAARPQVLLDVQTYEVDGALLRQLGLTVPVQFQLLQIPQNVIQSLSNRNIQQEIQQILSSGTLTPAQQQAIQALEAQLQNLQASGLTSLLNQPFITFGHGKTLFAATYPGQFAANFNFSTSYVTELEHATLRAAQGNTATLLIGTRFPVLTSTFALPGQTQTQNVGLSNFPTFNYEDLGITVKAKPQVHLYPPQDQNWRDLRGPDVAPEVTLELELAIKALAGSSFNGVPVISNRQYKGTVRLRDGEPGLVVGAITRDQERSLSGIPGLGQVPALGRLVSNGNVNNSEDELMVIITPHIVRLPGSLIVPDLPVPAGQ